MVATPHFGAAKKAGIMKEELWERQCEAFAPHRATARAGKARFTYFVELADCLETMGA